MASPPPPWLRVPSLTPGWEYSGDPVSFAVRSLVTEMSPLYLGRADVADQTKAEHLAMLTAAHLVARAAKRLAEELALEAQSRSISNDQIAQAIKDPASEQLGTSGVTHALKRWALDEHRNEQIQHELQAWRTCIVQWLRIDQDEDQDQDQDQDPRAGLDREKPNLPGEYFINSGITNLIKGLLHLNTFVKEAERDAETLRHRFSEFLECLSESQQCLLRVEVLDTLERHAWEGEEEVDNPTLSVHQFQEIIFLVQMAVAVSEDTRSTRSWVKVHEYLDSASMLIGLPGPLAIFESINLTLERDYPDLVLGSRMTARQIIEMYERQFNDESWRRFL